MRRILFQQTDFNTLPNPPAGFKYIGFDGPNFSEKSEDGQISQNIGGTGATGPQGIQGPTGPAGSGGSASTDRLISSSSVYTHELILDNKGTLNIPLLLPVTFNAICDDVHYDGDPNFSDTNWWEFEVEFAVNPNGEVETLINNIFPILTNPGYNSGDVFIFTEEDHGIPNFTFELQLNDVVFTGGVHWTANLTVTQPPIYPSTINSEGAIKLTSNSNNLIFGTLGDLTIPGTIISNNSINLEAGDSVSILTNVTGETQSFTFDEDGKFTLPSGASIVDSNFTGADGQNAVLAQYDGNTQIYTMQNGVGIQTHNSGSFSTWTFDSTGDLTLPQGGDIKNYLGNSVLGGGVSLTEVTYSDLRNLITSSDLSAGTFYKISDFRTCYDQPDFDIYGNGVTNSNTYHSSDIDPIIVFATSENTLDSVAYQPSYPKDHIRYDISWTQSEVTGGTAYGRITERIDEYGNRTDYDHRTVLFKRYKTRFLNGTRDGKILSVNDGLVIGTNSNFTGVFATGSVVFIESDDPKFYKVISITSDTEMEVEGRNYHNFTDPIGYSYQETETRSQPVSGCLYYFNDEGDDSINDGGDDMYDGANRLNTNLYSQIPYTHTQMTDVNGQAELSDFTYDGTVQDGTSYFGASSSYFTNLYPGLFVMSAYGVDITDFSISGNLGSDGDGQCEGNRFEWEGFTIFTKVVHSAAYDGETDPSIVHIIIVDTIDPSITHSFDDTTRNDDDAISNLSNVNTIHYLLFGLSLGVKPTTQQIESVYQSYLNTINDLDINLTLSNLNANFDSVTEFLPPNAKNFVSLETKLPNIIGDEVDYREILTFDSETGLSVTARNNYLGNTCDSYLDNERIFMLPNNVFTNCDNNTVDVYDNNFGNKFYNNTFGDDVWENHVLGNRFANNLCYDRFRRNTIKYFFYNNIFYSLEFDRNIIGGDFSNNIFITGSDFENNNIQNNFSYNKFFSNSSFFENDIAGEFNSNRVFQQFYRNKIELFNSNIVYDNFYFNNIGQDSYNNIIGSASNPGEFSRNDILHGFSNNTINRNFSYNVIGNYFSGNTIKDDFGFGGGQARGNRIGNYFQGNTIGEYFYDNIIADVFNNNLVGDNFVLNDIKVQNLNGINFTTYQGNIVFFTDNIASSISGSDGVYTLPATGGSGQGAMFNVTVSGGVVTLVQINDAGKFYVSGNVLTIASAGFGGSADIIITVTNETVPVVYQSINSTIVRNINSDLKLYYLGTAGIEITEINQTIAP